MCASRSQQHTSSLSCVVQIGTYGAHHLSTPRSKLNHRTRLLEEYIWILIPLRILNTPQTFPFILSHKKNFALYVCFGTVVIYFFIFYFFHSQHLELRGLDSRQQSSEDLTLMPSGDREVLWPLISIIFLHFTLADGIKNTIWAKVLRLLKV